MSYLKFIIPIIVIVIIGGIIVFNSDQDVNVEKDNQVEIQWRTSGPFSIEKFEYYLGEKIFLNVNNIPKDVKGEAIFFRPSLASNIDTEKYQISENTTTKERYLGIQFDGNQKDNFNRYFEPRFSQFKEICSTEDLVGEWVVVFEGTEYQPIFFKILNETASWDNRTFEPIC